MPAARARTTMADTAVYLEKLCLFGSILRGQGLEVTTADTADACAILIDLGLCDRDRVRTALRTVYARSRDEQLKFDRVFDSFFIGQDLIAAAAKKHSEQRAKQQEALRAAEKELEQYSPSVAYSDAQKEAYAMLPEEEKKRLRDVYSRFTSDGSRNPNLYSGFIHSVFVKSILEQQIMMEDAATGAAPVDPELGMLFRDISTFKDTEIPKAVYYIRNIAKRINGELSGKRRNHGRSDALDFRRTIRKGLETGGSFYHPVYKRRRARRRRLVVLCDVSASMIQFSEFVLRLIQALDQTAESSKVFLFSEESVEADKSRLQNMDLFREYVRGTGIYGKGTNLGRALSRLNSARPAVLSGSAMLLIISDGKTVDTDLACAGLMHAKQNAGKVFWMNPVAESHWKYSSSITAIAGIVPMIPCSTLDELAAACRRLVFV